MALKEVKRVLEEVQKEYLNNTWSDKVKKQYFMTENNEKKLEENHTSS